MSSEYDLPRDRLEFVVEQLDPAPPAVIILSGVMAVCTSCKAIKPMSEIGLRIMEDGTIRNQSQCTVCRSS